MSFNKHLPHRVDPPAQGLSKVDRAVFLRMAGWVSTLMLVTGYVLLFFLWN